MALTLVTETKVKYSRLDACKRFVDSIRHSSVLNMEVLEANETSVVARLPWQQQLA